jgi:hypothetical protein
VILDSPRYIKIIDFARSSFTGEDALVRYELCSYQPGDYDQAIGCSWVLFSRRCFPVGYECITTFRNNRSLREPPAMLLVFLSPKIQYVIKTVFTSHIYDDRN